MSSLPRRAPSSTAVLVIATLAVIAVGLTAYFRGRHDATALVLNDLSAANPLGFWEERRPLLERYQRDGKHSISYEEWAVRDFFHDERDGIFLDVGSADPIDHSNTYFLEHKLGWSGLAIDAVPDYAAAYKASRPRTVFAAYFISDTTDDHVTFRFLTGRPLSSTADKGWAEQWRGEGKIETRQVQTVTLNDLLSKVGLDRVDFVSIDIELHEAKALAGFDLARYRPRLLCIEAFPPIRQQIIDMLARQGYVIVGKYLRIDGYNLWFAPLVNAEDRSRRATSD